MCPSHRSIDRRRRLIAFVALLVASGAALNCSRDGSDGDLTTEPAVPSDTSTTATVNAVVSNPVNNPAAAAAARTVYVSMPPGSIGSGDHAVITNRNTGAVAAAAMVDGGFDPVAIVAEIGHVLTIEVVEDEKVTARTEITVEERRPPTIVRTQPPARKRDVPLNSIIVIVFSEPIDPTTVDNTSIQLIRNDKQVSGAIRFLDPASLTAELRPSELLSPNTTYELVLSKDIRDEQGEVLDPVIVDFVTEGLLPGSLTIMGGDNQTDTFGATLPEPLTVSVRHDGRPLAGVTVEWECVDCELDELSIPSESLTDGDGIASAPVTLGTSPGTWHVDASVDSVAVRFVVQVQPPAPPTLLVVSGNNQSDTILSTLPEPFTVRVVRDGDVPVEGVIVRWTELPGGASGTFVETGFATANTVTDQNGIASARLGLHELAGQAVVEASLPGHAAAGTSRFTVWARGGTPVSFVGDSARNMWGEPGLLSLTGISLPPFYVLARDSYGNIVPPQNLEWSVVSGTGVVTPLQGTQSAVATPLADGLLVVAAAADGLAPVTFDVYGVAAKILTVSGLDSHCNEGSFRPDTVEVAAQRLVGWIICWDGSDFPWTLIDGDWHWLYDHSVTFEDGVVVWPSTAGPTSNWSPHFRVFDVPGTYRFRCTLHSTGFGPEDGETGVVIVR